MSINQINFVIDIMNVVTEKINRKKNYRFEKLLLLIDEIGELGSCYLIVPRYLRKYIDEKKQYDDFLRKNKEKVLEFNPRKNISNDNYFIEVSRKIDGYIVTNDLLREITDNKIKERILPFEFIKFDEKNIVILPWKEMLLDREEKIELVVESEIKIENH